ncbi:MAG TPA: hypothetical protein VKE51_41905 [Vicinamibacterales bacterium]|nr:hypothetical protein [Vicinamibacterales bacterium]
MVVAATQAPPAGVALPLVWHVEHDRGSSAEMSRADASTQTLRFTLGAGRAADQFSALVGAISGGLAAYRSVTFSGRADHPMRIGVHLRPRGRDNPPRWQRSVYLDESPRTVTIEFADLRPVPRTVAAAVPLDSIDAVMFVVDTNNTAPGTSGVVTIGGLVWRALD